MLRGLKMSFVFNFVLRLLCISYLPKVVLSIVHALYFKKLPDPKNRNILWVIDWFYVCLNLYNSKRFMWEARMTMRTTDDDEDEKHFISTTVWESSPSVKFGLFGIPITTPTNILFCRIHYNPPPLSPKNVYWLCLYSHLHFHVDLSKFTSQWLVGLDWGYRRELLLHVAPSPLCCTTLTWSYAADELSSETGYATVQPIGLPNRKVDNCLLSCLTN